MPDSDEEFNYFAKSMDIEIINSSPRYIHSNRISKKA